MLQWDIKIQVSYDLNQAPWAEVRGQKSSIGQQVKFVDHSSIFSPEGVLQWDIEQFLLTSYLS